MTGFLALRPIYVLSHINLLLQLQEQSVKSGTIRESNQAWGVRKAYKENNFCSMWVQPY